MTVLLGGRTTLKMYSRLHLFYIKKHVVNFTVCIRENEVDEEDMAFRYVFFAVALGLCAAAALACYTH